MKVKLVLILLLPVLFASGACGGGAEDVEKAEEEAGVEEVVPEETTTEPPESVFEGEHTDLSNGDTAVWSNGLELTISDVHVAPNEGKAIVQRAEATTPGWDKDPKGKSKVENEPDELIVYRWHIENNGSDTIRFGGSFPCEFLDENGVALGPGGAPGGTTREQMEELKAKSPRLLEQPVEPGKEREAIGSVAPPTEGTTIEIVCVQPPRAGGGPGKTKVAEASEHFKASWLIDVSELERRG